MADAKTSAIHQEVEAKFLLVNDAEADALLRALGQRTQLTADRTLVVTDTYLDTPAFDLYRAGLGCRIRQRGTLGPDGVDAGRWTFECKSIASGAGEVKSRDEVEQALQGPTSVLDLLIQGPVGDFLKAHLPAPLAAILRLVNQRRRYRARFADTELEVSVDDVQVVDLQDAVRGRFRELELELVHGDAETLDQLVKDLLATLPLRVSRLGKLERALWMAGRILTGESPTRASDHLASLLKPQLHHDLRLITQSLEVALEGQDPEGAHRLRTHVRRLRATLAACGNAFGPEVIHFSRRFKALADTVGDMRDNDVYATTTIELLKALPAVRERTVQNIESLLVSERKRIQKSAFAVLAAPDVQILFGAFREWLDARAPDEGPVVAEVAARELGRRTRSVRKGLQGVLTAADDAALHVLRICIKKLRYVLELFEPLLGKRLEALTVLLRGLQDRLGERQDACVAISRGQQLAAVTPLLPQNRDVLVTLGRLQRERELKVEEIRCEFVARKGRRRLARVLNDAIRSE